jgi:hypothetical protein
LLQLTLISATAAKPTTAALRSAIVFTGFLSRLCGVGQVAADLLAGPGRNRTT